MPSTPPPYDSDAESAAIGCCLHNAEATRWATEWLCPADFYVPKWSTAFAAIVALYQEGQKADPVTVADRAGDSATRTCSTPTSYAPTRTRPPSAAPVVSNATGRSCADTRLLAPVSE